jgi:YVTN family beta-propeller protein
LSLLVACSSAPRPSVGSVRTGSRCLVDAPGPELEYVYVVDERGDSVSVINPRTCTVAATIPVGDGPVAANATQSGAWVIIANRDGRSLSFIDDDEHAVHREVALGFAPVDMWFGGGRRLLWVVGEAQTAVYDTVTNELLGPWPVAAAPLAMTRSQPATAVLGASGGVTLREEADTALRGEIDLGGPATALGYSEATDAVFACVGSDLVALSASGDPAWTPTRLALPQPCVAVRFEDCSAHGVALLADRSTAVLVDAEGPTILQTVEVAEGVEAAVFVDGRAVVHAPGSAQVSMLSFDPSVPHRVLDVGMPRSTAPREIRASLDGRHVYVLDTEQGAVHIVDAREGRVRGTVVVGGALVDLIVAGPAGGSCC